jgi:hypothetical protein
VNSGRGSTKWPNVCLPGLKTYDGQKVGFPWPLIINPRTGGYRTRLDIDGGEHHYFLAFEQFRSKERPKAFSLFFCVTTSADGSLELEGKRDQPPRQDPPSWSELCNDNFDP